MDGSFMIYRIEFSKDAQKVIKKWKKSNLPLFKKLEKLIPELSEHPRTDKGHPEPLKGGNDTRILDILLPRTGLSMTYSMKKFLCPLLS